MGLVRIEAWISFRITEIMAMVGRAKLFVSRSNAIDCPTINQAKSQKSADQPFVTDRIEPPRRCTLCSVEERLLKGTTDTCIARRFIPVGDNVLQLMR
jgi:hypothetical protein